jgi:hypothetical protein
MQVPPNPFDRIGFRRLGGQKVKHYPITPLVQEIANRPTVVEASIVTNHMDAAIAPQPAAEVVQKTVRCPPSGSYSQRTWRPYRSRPIRRDDHDLAAPSTFCVGKVQMIEPAGIGEGQLDFDPRS